MSVPKSSVYSSKSDEDFWEYGVVKEEQKKERNSIIDRRQITPTFTSPNQKPMSPRAFMYQKPTFLDQKLASGEFTRRKLASPETTCRRIFVQSKESVTEEEAEKLFQEELKAMEESEKSDDHQSDKATHTCSPVTDSQMKSSLKRKEFETGSEEDCLVSSSESDISIITLTNEIRPKYNPEVRESLRSQPSPSGSMITVISIEEKFVKGNENRSNRDMMYPSDLPKPRIAFREKKKPGLFGIIRRQIGRVGRYFRKRVGALSCI